MNRNEHAEDREFYPEKTTGQIGMDLMVLGLTIIEVVLCTLAIRWLWAW